MDMMTTLMTCKEGWEKIMAGEAALYGGTLRSKGRGWALVEWRETTFEKSFNAHNGFCFAHYIMEGPQKISAASVNSLTARCVDLFLAYIAGKRIDKPWPYHFSASGDEQLAGRAQNVEADWRKGLAAKVARVAKLAVKDVPYQPQFTDGFFVHFTDYGEAFVSFGALSAGQQRMRMDPLAPSRSYLKMEEAFCILGCEPRGDDSVVDLGAAPGGWSYSALKRGAYVMAVDNGPLKGEVAIHPQLTHLRADALTYKRMKSEPADWLFCDILAPADTILSLLDHWLAKRWCRRFVVNLKLGRADPLRLLNEIRDSREGLASRCKRLYVRQLYHDREEITLMGEANV